MRAWTEFLCPLQSGETPSRLISGFPRSDKADAVCSCHVCLSFGNTTEVPDGRDWELTKVLFGCFFFFKKKKVILSLLWNVKILEDIYYFNYYHYSVSSYAPSQNCGIGISLSGGKGVK